MKSLPIVSLKGGTGKSTVCAHLGLSLRDKGFRIGFLDIDVTGSNLPSALGIAEPFPHVGLDTEREKMLAVNIAGYDIFSLAFRFGTTAALMWQGGEMKVEAFGKQFVLHGTGRYELVRQMLQNVEFPELDYLLIDMPPGSGDETLSLFEHVLGLWGVILVCQPTNLAVQDIQRTLNMIEVKRIPLLGMVGNMTQAICPQCHCAFPPFLDAGIDLEGFCSQRAIPYLTSIPLTPAKERINEIFDSLADDVLKLEPIKIWQKSFKQKLQEAAIKGAVKALFAKEK